MSSKIISAVGPDTVRFALEAAEQAMFEFDPSSEKVVWADPQQAAKVTGFEELDRGTAYDELIDELARTGDIAKRGEIAIKMNNMLTKDSNTIVPLVHRGRVSAHASSLGGVVLNVWDSELWNVADWYRID